MSEARIENAVLDKVTEHALESILLEVLFRERFDGTTLPAADGSGAGPYRFELSVPDTYSTEAGRLAVQHVKLVPSEGSALVAGSAIQLDRIVTFRGYESLESIHRQRFHGAPLPLAQHDYEVALADLVRFFETQRFQVRFAEGAVAPPRVPGVSPAPASRKGWSLGTAAAATAAAAVVLGVVGWIALAHPFAAHMH